MGFNRIWRGGKPLPACIPVGVLSPWNAEWDHPDTLCRQSRLPLGQHSWCWEHRSHPSPFPAGSSLPSEDPKAQRGLWESGPAESGQRGWSDSIDRNLIPNWLRRRTPARPGFELPGRTNPPVSAGFWEAGSGRPRPKPAAEPPGSIWASPASRGCRGLGASRKDPSPVARPRIPSHLPSSCSQGQSPRRDLQPPPAAFPGFPRSFPGTLVMLELPVPAARPSLWSQAPP